MTGRATAFSPPGKRLAFFQRERKVESRHGSTRSGDSIQLPQMSNPLPQFEASLSKYFRVEDHFALVGSISHDTPEGELRSRFDTDLYVTARARYLIVKDKVVCRDKLIDLIHEEGKFTERVKMVMYFLFMFRDPRYRQFICTVLGGNHGKWDTSIFSDTQSEFFPHAGGRKAFTNLRQFLSQTGIIDEGSWRAHMPDPSGWFPAAVQIASNSIDDVKTRKSFLASPHGFLIRYGINALLNITPEGLAQLEFGGTYEESDDLLPQTELPETDTRVDIADFKSWNRVAPSKRKRGLQISTTDSIVLERASSQHFLLEERISQLCRDQGLEPMTNRHVDLVVDSLDTSILFEMKSCGLAAVRGQLRRAISQLLEYRFLYRDNLRPEVIICAVVERKPQGRLTWLISYVESLGIGLIWKNDQDDKLNCSDATSKLLVGILPQVANADF